MNPLILITGGARSGKSRLAEEKARELSDHVLYIATAIAFDEGMKDRIKKHKDQRPDHWTTLEKYKDFKNIIGEQNFKTKDLILLDCITLMVSNLMLDSKLDFETCKREEIDNLERYILKEVEDLLNIIEKHNKTTIIVTNEVGMGLVPAYRMGNIFRDIAGRVNQYIANKADRVYFTVSGIEMKIK